MLGTTLTSNSSNQGIQISPQLMRMFLAIFLFTASWTERLWRRNHPPVLPWDMHSHPTAFTDMWGSWGTSSLPSASERSPPWELSCCTTCMTFPMQLLPVVQCRLGHPRNLPFEREASSKRPSQSPSRGTSTTSSVTTASRTFSRVPFKIPWRPASKQHPNCRPYPLEKICWATSPSGRLALMKFTSGQACWRMRMSLS